MPDFKSEPNALRVDIICVQTSPLAAWWENVNFSAPFWRLYWHESQGVTVLFRHKRIILPPDRLCLIPPNTSFAGRLSRRVHQLYIHFLSKTSPFNTVEPNIYTWPCNGELRRMTRQLFKNCRGRDEGHIRTSSLLSLALVYAGLSRLPDSVLRPLPSVGRLSIVLEAIEDHLKNPLDNGALARRIGMNTNAFIRLFRTVIGQTPQAYSLRRRIDKASIQLLFGSQSIEEIAGEFGFCDRYHFSRTFRKIRGIGPGAYQRDAFKELNSRIGA